ncbi:TPA: hypothetical protein LUJ97_001682 [Acinetobacter nosocomialis]|nr:hypothetical protein [Acinetobacter nosocomialis]
MTDLNKLRSEYEAWVLQESPQMEWELNLKTDGEYDSAALSWAWAAWQEKAKAQAVPDTHIVVPKELYNFQANRLAEEEFNQNKKLFDMEHRGLSGTKVELRKLKWLQCKAESIKQNYRRLVNWASESGAEG